jgi:glyoxylase-like metal-dependent hydrolase (beta-lactamase superfamily II)
MTDWVLTSLAVGPLAMNAYLLESPATGEAALFDPGDEADLLLDRLAAGGLRLTLLACTHGHFDHVGAAAAVQAIHPLPLLVHPRDEALVRTMPRHQEMFGFPPTAVPRLSATLADGAILPFGGGALTVRHIPGHTPGHVLFGWETNALVGDCIFAGSVGRTDLPGGNFQALERSIRERIYTLPAATGLHPGHGPSTTVAEEMTSNPYVRPTATR